MKMIRGRKLETIQSGSLPLPDESGLIHLQFRRFAGCPFCSVHLRAFVRRHDEIVAAGVKEVVVFRSTAAALRRHHPDLPFAVVADPEGALYAEFGVRSGLAAVFDPRALLALVRDLARLFPKIPGMPPSGEAAFGFPADFLIGVDGGVLAGHHGKHADDQWSVDQLLELAGALDNS